MNIIVDAMGGDHAPKEIVGGVIAAVKEFNIDITLVGIDSKIKAELAKYSYPAEKINIVHTDEIIGMHEPATSSIRKKKDSSISIGYTRRKEKRAKARMDMEATKLKKAIGSSTSLWVSSR